MHSSEQQPDGVPDFIQEHQVTVQEDNRESLSRDKLDQLKDSLAKMVTLKELHKKNKEVNAKVHAEFEKFESKAMGILKDTGLVEFRNETHTIKLSVKKSVLVPKTLHDKRALFAWLREHKGEDALTGFQSIASTTLNAFYKEELKEHQNKTGELEFHIPGVAMGASIEKLSLTKLKVEA